MGASQPFRVDDRAGAVLTIDLSALVANWRLLKSRASPACDMGAVVKADAYGLGLAPAAKALAAAGCKSFYVAHPAEGIAARAALGTGPRIAVMHGPNPGTEKDFAQHRLIPVLNTPDQIARWRSFSAREDFLGECIVHVDTGMNRLGLTTREFAEHMESDGFLGLYPLALMSHLACSDEPAHTLNASQRERFASHLAQFRAKFPDAKGSLANSAGIFLGFGYHYDLARPGIALYGANPTPGAPNPMVPVVRLYARILQVRRVDQGSSVGYGATTSVPDGAKLATVSIGYADGVLRAWGPSGVGYIDDFKVKIAGRVSMDLTIFDVTHVPDSSLHPGVFVEVIGPHQGVDALGEASGTIGYEILTKLGARYQRHYLPA